MSGAKVCNPKPAIDLLHPVGVNCAVDNYINEHVKKGLEIQRKNRSITPEQHIQVLKNLCISLEEHEQILKPKRTGTDIYTT